MKLPTLKRARNAGHLLLVVAVAVVAVVVIGYTSWKIYKALQKLGQTTASRQRQIEEAGEDCRSNIVERITAEFPDTPWQFVSLETNLVTSFEPFDATNVSVWIERSTNLVDWEPLKLLSPGEAWSDPSPPWPQAFYRRRRPE